MAIGPRINFSSKRMQISKANAAMVGIVAGAVFLTVFSLVSAKSLWTQRGYQARVIGKKEKARNQLKENIGSVQQLVTSYKSFVESPENMLGGNPSGSGDKDGDNGSLILDALPSKYDFPALTTSLEKILVDKKFKIGSITGTDDEVAQSKNAVSDNPQPVDVPFEVNVSGSYSGIQDLVSTFERSIRPINMNRITLSGNNNTMQFTMSAKTYYQPEKQLKIKQELVQ